jgi:hypothetical protein
MTKDEMTTLLRSVGCDENTVTAMGNAYEIGYEAGELAGYNAHLINLQTIGKQNEQSH